jgi:type II secretory pathway predicted ATPase ExeA
VSLDKLSSYFGFTRTPFRRDLAPAMLHRHGGHAEAVARIRWCVAETALGVITGEVGAGKTVALRAALAELDASRHTVISCPTPRSGPAASTPPWSRAWAGSPASTPPR